MFNIIISIVCSESHCLEILKLEDKNRINFEEIEKDKES